jgi:hypothetical protein
MDNLPAHKGARVEHLIKSALQPGHEPDREGFFEVKAYLRKIAQRTVAGALEARADIFSLPNGQITSPPATRIQFDRSLL